MTRINNWAFVFVFQVIEHKSVRMSRCFHFFITYVYEQAYSVFFPTVGPRFCCWPSLRITPVNRHFSSSTTTTGGCVVYILTKHWNKYLKNTLPRGTATTVSAAGWGPDHHNLFFVFVGEPVASSVLDCSKTKYIKRLYDIIYKYKHTNTCQVSTSNTKLICIDIFKKLTLRQDNMTIDFFQSSDIREHNLTFIYNDNYC